jgi:N-acetylglucosamine kinase-like BadF-type ATPase
METILVLDAGGTSTRAAVVDRSGTCLGVGVAGPGNPTSAGLEAALESVAAATAAALAQSGPREPEFALIAMAGSSLRFPRDRVAERLRPLGLRGGVEVESDLLGVYHSGSIRPEGYALVAGTGSVAARIRGGRLDRVADGTGWLLGDRGSGFWIGRRVARSVVAELDGLGPATALTGRLLAALGLAEPPGRGESRVQGRPAVLPEVVDRLYAMRPVELSRFAPLAFDARNDAVAAGILSEAADLLCVLFAAIHEPGVDGPVVVGGSVLLGLLDPSSPVAERLSESLGTQVLPARDGVVGAAVLGLLHAGVRVDDAMFERLGRAVARLRSPAGEGEVTDG